MVERQTCLSGDVRAREKHIGACTNMRRTQRMLIFVKTVSASLSVVAARVRWICSRNDLATKLRLYDRLGLMLSRWSPPFTASPILWSRNCLFFGRASAKLAAPQAILHNLPTPNVTRVSMTSCSYTNV